ncbi:hypothetical protein CLCR_04405 [Cladophialophora carrionii]|uniref:Uncharacterized protein n=1 Tax=Cladophialophora carrionii TaxID=86049 RepID=A0A1C1CJ07_9EURO|nr:hypothetical protein CLCR_04405 [Cladophialophora carrionii]
MAECGHVPSPAYWWIAEPGSSHGLFACAQMLQRGNWGKVYDEVQRMLGAILEGIFRDSQSRRLEEIWCRVADGSSLGESKTCKSETCVPQLWSCPICIDEIEDRGVQQSSSELN